MQELYNNKSFQNIFHLYRDTCPEEFNKKDNLLQEKLETL